MSVNDDIQKKKERMIAEMKKAELEKQQAERMKNALNAAGMSSYTPVLLVPASDLKAVIDETMANLKFNCPKIVREMPDKRAMARKTKAEEKADMYSFDIELYRNGSGKDEYIGELWIFKNGAIACSENGYDKSWSKMRASGITANFVREKIIEKIALMQIESDRPKSNNANSNDGCYIATAVYGTYDCPELWVLRRYRDYELRRNPLGRAFIRIYYSTSPKLVRIFGDSIMFNTISKKLLDKKVEALRVRGYSDKEYYGK